MSKFWEIAAYDTWLFFYVFFHFPAFRKHEQEVALLSVNSTNVYDNQPRPSTHVAPVEMEFIMVMVT